MTTYFWVCVFIGILIDGQTGMMLMLLGALCGWLVV